MGSRGTDTIAAVATAPGPGGIGIVRVSGPRALEIGGAVFRPKKGGTLRGAAPSTLLLGTVVDPLTGEALDEALAVRMTPGRSYSGEETVEIQGHGGPAVLRSVLRAVLAAGARAADPGEFTRRAFLSGRLDLAQAEAVAELIGAASAAEHRAALRQLRGETGRAVRGIRNRVVELAAAVEAQIAFAEEEEGLDAQVPSRELDAVRASIDRLLAAARRRRSAARGLRVLVAGPANAGKSSLFNYLCGMERAIVHPDPGTTRDYIEQQVVSGGAEVLLVDTAGIRESRDTAERIGIERSLAQVEDADLVLLLFDRSSTLAPRDLEIIPLLSARPCLAVLTKSDLPAVVDREAIEALLPAGTPLLATSIVTGEGCMELIEAIAGRARREAAPGSLGDAAPNERQAEALARCSRHLRSADSLLESPSAIDRAAEEMRDAIRALDEVTGEGTTEDVLDRVFSRFCVGK